MNEHQFGFTVPADLPVAIMGEHGVCAHPNCTCLPPHLCSSAFKFGVSKFDGLVEQHTFNRCVNTTLAKCSAISDQRGGEYQDTWATENINTPFGDAIDRLPGHDRPEWKRLRTLAALCDVKISRLLGPWKEDTCVDAINYIAALTQLMNEYNG